MAKLVALLATLLVVAHVTAAYHSTITTVETIDSDNPGRQGMTQECQREVQEQNLRPCMEYLTEEQGGGRYGGMGTRGGSQQLGMCCRKLQNFRDQQCMCQGLEMEMEKMGPRQMMGGMMQVAENLPSTCGVMSSPCHFRSRAY